MRGVQDNAIEELKSNLRGRVLLPDDPQYNEARAVWNAMIDRKPGIIVRCAGAADVMRSVTFARAHGLRIAVRGGGHNIAGSAVCDGGMMIDLSAMKSVQVNPQKKRAYVEPGATLGDLDQEAQTFGLAVPVGINSTTGVAGLALGGGFGWLTRKYGLSVDSLEAAEVVLADGRKVRADARENPDLFWAIRGGGGNFGIVTLFEFRLHRIGPEVFCGMVVFPFAQARPLLEKYRGFLEAMPEDLNVWMVLRKAPPLPFLPKDVHGKEVVVFPFLHAGNIEEGKHAIEPLRRFGTPHGEHMGAMPFAAWQKTFDPLLTPGARNYWKSHNLVELSDGLIDALVAYAAKLPSPRCEIFVATVGGAMNRVATDATAYPHRDAKFIVNVHGRWVTPQEDTRCIAWAREFFQDTARFATGGVYVNFLTQDEADRVPAAYGANYERLVRLKEKYDPENTFSMNQNIAPAAQARK